MNEENLEQLEILERSAGKLSFRYFRDRVRQKRESRIVIVPVLAIAIAIFIIEGAVIASTVASMRLFFIAIIIYLTGFFIIDLIKKPPNSFFTVEIDATSGIIAIKVEKLARKDPGSIASERVRTYRVEQVKKIDVTTYGHYRRNGKFRRNYRLLLFIGGKFAPQVLFETTSLEGAVDLMKLVRNYISL